MTRLLILWAALFVSTHAVALGDRISISATGNAITPVCQGDHCIQTINSGVPLEVLTDLAQRHGVALTVIDSIIEIIAEDRDYDLTELNDLALLDGAIKEHIDEVKRLRAVVASWKDLGDGELVAIRESIKEALDAGDFPLAGRRIVEARQVIEEKQGKLQTFAADLTYADAGIDMVEFDFLSAGKKREQAARDMPSTQEKRRVLYLAEASSAFRRGGDLVAARELLTEAQEIAKKHNWDLDDPSLVAAIEHHLGVLELDQGRFTSAERHLKRAYVQREQGLGETTSTSDNTIDGVAASTWDTAIALAQAQVALARYDEARELLDSVRPRLKEARGGDHPQTVRAAVVYGQLERLSGGYDRAEAALKSVLDLASPRRELEYFWATREMAQLQRTLGRFAAADLLLSRALKDYEQKLPPEHPSISAVQHLRAELLHLKGRFTEALALAQYTAKVRADRLGHRHPDTLASRELVAEILRSRGHYAEAESLLKQTLQQRLASQGRDHPGTLEAHFKLAKVYSEQSRHQEALEQLKRCDEGRRGSLGEIHPDTLQVKREIGWYHLSRGETLKAEERLRSVLGSTEQVFSTHPDHPNIAAARHDLGHVLMALDRLHEARELLQQAYDSYERVFGPTIAESLRVQESLAELATAEGHHEQAVARLKRAAERHGRVMGASHPYSLHLQERLAIAMLAADRPHSTQAGVVLRRIERPLLTYLDRELESTRRLLGRRSVLEGATRFVDLAVTLGSQSEIFALPKGPTRGFSADVLLRWKRFERRAEEAIARFARTSSDSDVRDIREALMRARSQLTHAVRLHNNQDHDGLLDKRLADVERLERELGRLARARGVDLSRSEGEWEDISAALPPDSALIEFRYIHPLNRQSPFEPPTEKHLIALLIPGGAFNPERLEIVDYGPSVASEVEEGLTELYRSLRVRDGLGNTGLWESPVVPIGIRGAASRRQPSQKEIESRQIQAGQPLYQLLVAPLEDRLARFDTVYVCPDDQLNQIPFHLLADDRGTRWIERQQIRQVASGMDLLPIHSTTASDTLLLLGGIDYTGRGRASPSSDASADRVSVRQQLRPSSEFHFFPLPGTRAEVDKLVDLVKHYRGTQLTVEKWTDDTANEGGLKSLSTPPRVLHLATHAHRFHPLHRGVPFARPLPSLQLPLAGANLGLKGKLDADGHDGLLSASEIQGLPLEGTELVVLSACKTIQGEPSYDGSAYSLARAFQIAGAKSVLATLWEVEDRMATVFMTDFYQHLLTSNTSGEPFNSSATAAALRATRLDWLGASDPQRSDPVHWGPYVLIERR